MNDEIEARSFESGVYGMNVIPTEGLTKEQVFALRGIGASDAVIICGKGHLGSSRLKLWYEKREGKPSGDHDEFTRNLFRWGNWLEDDIAACFEQDLGLKISETQVLVAHPEYPWATALIDMVTEDGQIADSKAHTWIAARNLVDGNPNTLPAKAHIQAAWQMWVCDKPSARWACFDGANLKLMHFLIDRDDELIETVVELVSRFKESVDLGIMPNEFDPEDCDYLKNRFTRVNEQAELVIEDHELIDHARLYFEAKEARSYADDQVAVHEAALRLATGDAALARIGPYTTKRTERSRKASTTKASSWVEFKVIGPKEGR
jgi:predicted phage-related endonuclease